MRLSYLAAALLSGLFLLSQLSPGQEESQKPSGYLGVYLVDLNADRAAALKLPDVRGVVVEHVNEGSPAEKAGIKEGDVILAYNGETVLGREQLGRLVRETPPDRKVKLQLWRNGKTQTLTVLLAAFNPRNLKQTPGPIPDDRIQVLGTMDFPRPIVVWQNVALGLEYESLEPQMALYFGVRAGVLVRAVGADAPAGKAGLRAGDVITAIGTRDIAAPNDLISYLHSQQQPIHSIEIQFFRDHKRRSATIPVN
jgi:serine protease Do